MTFSLAYWILMLLWLVLWLWHGWSSGAYVMAGSNLLLFLLFLLIGWKLFGPPLHG